MDKKAILKNFSKYARFYDRYADVQNLAALKLANGIKNINPANILEIGCGTGNYTLLLRGKFKNAKIKALDISKEMIEVALGKISGKHIEFSVSDAENADFNEKFDLITSNACFQWFDNLEKALIRYKKLMRKNSVISFSIFGPATFRELNDILKNKLKNTSVAADNFIGEEKIREILGKNFKKIRIKEFIYQESFPRLKDLLDKIKYTGVRGEGLAGRAHLNRRLLGEKISATYQIFFCQAIR